MTQNGELGKTINKCEHREVKIFVNVFVNMHGMGLMTCWVKEKGWFKPHLNIMQERFISSEGIPYELVDPWVNAQKRFIDAFKTCEIQ